MNKAILIGRVGQDVELKQLETTQVANCSLATSERWKDKQGQKQERTEWHNLVFFGSLASLAEKYIKKGDQLNIVGKIATDSYEDANKIKRYRTQIIVQEIEFLSSKSSDNTNTPPSNAVAEGDDLPF